MIINYYSIYDVVAEHYGTIFAAPTHGSAERMLEDSVNKPETPHNTHPKDYRLFYIGTFDDEHAKLESPDNPVLICEASALVRSSQ